MCATDTHSFAVGSITNATPQAYSQDAVSCLKGALEDQNTADCHCCCGETPNTKTPAALPGEKLKPPHGALLPAGAANASCCGADAGGVPLSACCDCCCAAAGLLPFQLNRLLLPGAFWCDCAVAATCGICSPPKPTEELPRHCTSNFCSRFWSPAVQHATFSPQLQKKELALLAIRH